MTAYNPKQAFMKIKSYEDSMLEEILQFSLRAWEPVFHAVRKTIDTEIFDEQSKLADCT
jgi:hypothetical protein